MKLSEMLYNLLVFGNVDGSIFQGLDEVIDEAEKRRV